MAGRAIGVYAPGVGGYAFDRGVGVYGEAVGADAAGEVARPRSCMASQRRGPAGLGRTASGIAHRGCHLGFCAAPQLRPVSSDRGLWPRDRDLQAHLGGCCPRIGPCGPRTCAAPQPRGPVGLGVDGLRDCVQGYAI